MRQRRPTTPVSIRFLGTGDAFNTDGRGSQALWVEARGQAPFLVDVGPTALQAMQAARLDIGALDRVFFTHLHGDHIAGWPFLLLHQTFVERRRRSLAVFGPRGTRERLARLATGCYEELVIGGRVNFPVRHSELRVKRAANLPAGRGCRLATVPMDHHPSSIGYRFRLGGRTLAVTGDTRWCPGLEELARGADLLVLECTCLEKPDYAHVSLEEVRARRDRLAARRIVLTHTSEEVAREAKRRPIEGVRVAEDGMRVGV